MTATAARSSNGVDASRLRGSRGTALRAGPAAGGPRRRRGRIVVGVVAVVIGAWVFAALYLSAGNKVDAVAVASNVARLDTITRADLRVVRVSADSGVAVVRSDQLDAMVGRVAATDLVAGSLLAPGQVRRAGDRVLDKREAIVGLLLGPGDAPGDQLRRGVAVLVVVRPTAETDGDPVEVTGRVFDASAAALSSGERPVEVVVPRADAATISAAGADKRVTVVALGE